MTEPFENSAQYPSVLTHKPGFFLNWVLYTLFKPVRVSPDMAETLKQMHRQGTVVYACKYRSHLDYLLYHYRYRSRRLPYPKIAFDMNISAFLPVSHVVRILRFQISYYFRNRQLPCPFKTGFFEKAIQEGTSALLSLVDPKWFVRHFVHSEKDHIHFLLEAQKTMDRPIFIVPQLILYKMTPEKDHPNLKDMFFGYKDNPGVIRKVVLFFRHNRRAFIDYGTPLNLMEYLAQQPEIRTLEEMSIEIKQVLIESIDLQKRVILGPVMKNRQQIKEKVLKDPDVMQAIEKKAGSSHKKLRETRKQADSIFNEIAADYNITYIQFFFTALKWMFKRIYQDIDIDTKELAMVREWARKGSLVYVPSHKSHVDYLVLNYLLFQNHMHIPRIAAGQNLSFWPMGFIFRKSGAFFIRRTFRGASLYPKVFARYIKQLLVEGHPLEFFIEGGRSRSGKLISPKTGFLSILLSAYAEGFAEDLVFVPASISYDKIMEEKSYLKELTGSEKQSESFRQMLTARHFLKRKYGKIYVRFSEPISFKNYLIQKNLPPDSASHMLALDLTKSINKVTLVTPLSLFASAILTRHRRGFRPDELFRAIKHFMVFLDRNHFPKAPSLNKPEKTLNETLALLTQDKVIDLMPDTGASDDLYFVHEEKKKELEYYKNSIIHFFIPNSFVAVSLLKGMEDEKSFQIIYEEYLFLKHLFNKEFVSEDDSKIEAEIRDALDFFLEADFIKHAHTHHFKLTRLGYEELPTWAALSKTFLEAYWVAMRSYIQSGDSGRRKKGDQLKRMNQVGLQFYKLGFIDHMESISQVSFKNAMNYINDEILKNESEEGAHQKLQDISQKIYDMSHY